MKPTQALLGRLRRLPLTTKQARKGFYKGNGVGMLGAFDPRSPRKFIPDWSKVRTYVYPATGLDGFELTPFVARKIGKFVQEGENQYSVPKKTITGQEYLDLWKETGGHDRFDGE